MTHWILFVFITNMPGMSQATAMTTRVFHSQQSCESAAKALKQSALAYEDIQTVCVEDKPGKNL